jgi:hypothetical protein
VGTAAAWISLRLPSVVDFTRDALHERYERYERYERSAPLHLCYTTLCHITRGPAVWPAYHSLPVCYVPIMMK